MNIEFRQVKIICLKLLLSRDADQRSTLSTEKYFQKSKINPQFMASMVAAAGPATTNKGTGKN
jgi:hypothetical protein